MVTIAVILSAVVFLLAVLVAGLLRSHADILKALHDLGVGVGEPTGDGSHDGAVHRHGADVAGEGGGRPGPVRVPFTMGPPLPSERHVESAPTVSGVTPGGDALAVAVTGGDHLTLLAFLSSGCSTCAGFWEDFSRPGHLGLPPHTRLVVVTKGPDMEIPAEVAAHAPPGLSVVMSTEAWGDYEVPGSPFFVLIDGRSGRRIGEGLAHQFHQVAELVRRADADTREFHVGSTGRAHAGGLDGPERELANDRELLAAGILPGDPSLYPSSLDELYGPDAGRTPRAGVGGRPSGSA